jgi:tetratricopeptide (TPR) repeat protein
MLVEQVALRQPLLLVLEDLHWADEMTLRLLAFVGRRVFAWRALLVATAREEELAHASMASGIVEELSRASQAMSLVLSPLSRSDTALLVRALTRVGSDAPTVASAEERIWVMSEGNPFVAEEAVRALDLGRVADAGRDDGVMLPLPARVRGLVVRRLDRLGARSQELVTVAAAIGRRFDFTLLQSASGMDERDAAEAVDEMVRHRVLQAVGGRLDFVHDRIREVAYGRLLPPRRRLLHRGVLAALETAGSAPGSTTDQPTLDRLDEPIDQLVHHALRGELWEKAVRYLRRAGTRATARSALQDARACFVQALEVLDQLPESRTDVEDAFEIRLELRSVLMQLGEYRPALERLREAEALAERLSDDRRRGRVAAFMANVHCRLNEPREAIASGTRALQIAGRLEDLSLRILATTYLGQAHYYCGEYARVIALTTDNLAALPAGWVHEFFGSSQPPSVNDRVRLLVSLAHLGRFAEAAAHEAEAIRLAELTRHAYTVGLAFHAASTLYLVKGDWTRACALIERQIAVLRTGTIVGELPTALADCARVLAYLGDATGALDRSRECEQLRSSQSARGPGRNAWVDYSLGRACLLLGRPGEARRLAEGVVESATSRIDFMPDALQLLGDIASHPDCFDLESAEGYYRQALALAKQRGMRPVIAHCHLGVGRLRARSGEHAVAAERLGVAATLYRDMAMTFWLEQAQGELRALG